MGRVSCVATSASGCFDSYWVGGFPNACSNTFHPFALM